MNQKQKLFFVGVGGVGMSALAVIAKARGYEVSGSNNVDSKVTDNLGKRGIDVRIGHVGENISSDIDLVVYTNAVSPDSNPELIRARELGIPAVERAVMLNLLAQSKFAVGVSGTHGKTTTTSLVSKIFLRAGKEPSLAVGGYLDEIDGSGYEGAGKYFIYEACEAFGSIGHLCPDIAIITNIDKDHLDYYGNIGNIKKMFAKYIAENVPPYGLVIYNKDDANLRGVVEACGLSNAISVGIRQKDVEFSAENVKIGPFSSDFTVKRRGKTVGEFRLNIPGLHNVYNALLAVVVCRLNGIPNEVIQEVLGSFRNAERRFQLKMEDANLTVIDDYAHHPAEIRATLNAAKKLSRQKDAQLIAVFQPHLYSRTEHFYKAFAKSLCQADRVVLTEIYAAREQNVHNISTQIIYEEIVKIKGVENVIYSHELNEVPEKIRDLLSRKSVLVTLGAGDVWKVSEMFYHHN